VKKNSFNGCCSILEKSAEIGPKRWKHSHFSYISLPRETVFCKSFPFSWQKTFYFSCSLRTLNELQRHQTVFSQQNNCFLTTVTGILMIIKITRLKNKYEAVDDVIYNCEPDIIFFYYFLRILVDFKLTSTRQVLY
jgi:hypothetical protein